MGLRNGGQHCRQVCRWRQAAVRCAAGGLGSSRDTRWRRTPPARPPAPLPTGRALTILEVGHAGHPPVCRGFRMGHPGREAARRAARAGRQRGEEERAGIPAARLTGRGRCGGGHGCCWLLRRVSALQTRPVCGCRPAMLRCGPPWVGGGRGYEGQEQAAIRRRRLRHPGFGVWAAPLAASFHLQSLPEGALPRPCRHLLTFDTTLSP
jgi:hypothetical protein